MVRSPSQQIQGQKPLKQNVAALEVRPAKPKDESALRALAELVEEHCEKAEFRSSLKSAKRLFQSQMTQALVLWDHNSPVAFVEYLIQPEAIEILYLATHPEHQCQGHMRQLLESLKQVAQQAELNIWLEVHDRNCVACQLYESVGFRRVGRRPSYYAAGEAAWLYSLL